MLIFAICILLNACIGVIFKLYDKYNIHAFQAIVANYFTCVIVGSLVLGKFAIPFDLLHKTWFPHALGLGILFVSIFTLFSKAVASAGVGVSTIFQKISLIAPAIIAMLIFGESVSLRKIIGIGLALTALIFMQYEKGMSIRSKSIFYLVLVFLGSCIIDSYMYLLEAKEIAPNGDIQFVSSLFLTAGLVGLLVMLVLIFQKKISISGKSLFAGILLGIPNFFSIYLILLLLAKGWEGSIVFPVNNVGVLLLSVLFGFLLFKEKLNALKFSGVAIATLAIYLISSS